ncbi:MAG: DNA polymerase I [Gammaproteobacteria bacterium]
MSDSERRPFLLLDGSAYLYRAFHAMPPLTTQGGFPTGAIKGVLTMLGALKQKHRPEYLAIVFDAPGPTFRHDLYPGYKAQRPAMPESLARQIEPLLDILRAQGFPLIRIPGIEADDILGTLARRAERQGFHVLIFSADKDLAQLVSDHIALVHPVTGQHANRSGIKSRYGVWPEQIVDYLALVGDSSDNIPGVPGVGPKTAARWLERYGSLQDIWMRREEFSGQTGCALRAAEDALTLAKRLVTLDCALELEAPLETLRMSPPDLDTLRQKLSDLELHDRSALAATASTSGSLPPDQAEGGGKPRTVAITRRGDLEQWIGRMRKAELVALDTETTSLNYLDARLVGLSLAVGPDEACYIPLRHVPADGDPPQLPVAEVLAALRPLLEDPDLPKVGHHSKYDRHIFLNEGIAVAGIRYDTMLESYVLNSTNGRHDLDSVAHRVLGIEKITYESVTGKGRSQRPFDEVRLDQATEYAGEDAWVTWRLHQRLWQDLAPNLALVRIVESIEIPLSGVLLNMERTGVRIDPELLRAQSAELLTTLESLRARAFTLAGKSFNLDSPKQLQTILFEELGIPSQGKTPGGQLSTAETVLEELAPDHELPRVLLEYRRLAKLRSTYTERLPSEIHPATGRVHTSYHQATTATGRLSSSDPNLQNIPIRTPEGQRIRRAFIATPGSVILSLDYSQIELRILAHFSKDPGLSSAFANGIDVHRATAAELFGIAPEAVDGEQRRLAKTINFGLIYGMSAFGLARQLSLSRELAQSYIERYFTRYPRVRDFMDHIRSEARERGYVETVLGRRLYLPNLKSRQHVLRQAAERAAINAPMQGTAADIIKTAMIRTEHWLKQGRFHAQLLMQVHDELVLEVPEEEIAEVTPGVRDQMTGAVALTIPLTVEIGMGSNWDEAH